MVGLSDELVETTVVGAQVALDRPQLLDMHKSTIFVAEPPYEETVQAQVSVREGEIQFYAPRTDGRIGDSVNSFHANTLWATDADALDIKLEQRRAYEAKKAAITSEHPLKAGGLVL